MSLTWATMHSGGVNSLAQQFPSFQINAQDARSGNVHVESRSPSGRTQDMSVVENHGVFTANFTPTEVGDWLISIMYDKTHIQGSPFNVRVYDAEQVRVYGLEDGAIGKTFSFNVETAGAGEGELTVDIMHNGRSVPVQIQPDGRSRYRVAFTPSGGGVYTIRVHFAGMEVRGSPYTVEIVDSTRVSASGDGLTMAEVNQRASFIINTDGGKSITDLRVTITSPRGSYIPSNVVSNGDGTFRVEYTVNEVGEYSIEVLYHGKAIVGSPFRAQASDWSRITVTNLRSLSSVGKLVEFDIDATKAGSGNLEIMVNDGTIPCSVQNRGNKHFHASFMPKEAMPHTVQMRFNGRDVPNSPWVVEIRGITNVTVSGPGLQLIPVNRVTYFEVDTGTGGGYDGEVSVSILTTNGRNVPCRINNNNNGIYRVEYTPTEVGNQMTDVLFDGKAVPGSPFVSKVYESSAITISPITAATVGRPVDFTIDVTRAGEGQLEIMINQGSVPNTVKMLRKGVFQVTFTPREPRTHEVDVKFNGESLPGCPMNVAIMDTSRVTVQGDGLRQVAVNRQSYFRVNTQSAGDADLAVRVTSPQGRNVPARITGDSDNGFDVEYTPTETGMHRVDVEYASQLVPGSPFTVSCFDNNAIQVIGVQDGIVGRASSFIVDANNAGEGNMEISIVAGGQNLQNHVRQVGQGRFEVSYTPVASGPHHGTVTFNGLLVPGSPFVFSAADASRVSAQGDGLSLVPTNKPAVFNINAPGARTRDLDVTVIGVHSEIVPCSLRETTIPDNFIAEWMPKDIGDYRIEIKYTGLPIPGSPFTARAWSEQRVLVSNIHPGSISKPLAFNIDASQAGAGNLEISVCVGDTNVPNFVKSEGNARFTVSFTPQITDTHMINVKFNANMVPGSPFFCTIVDGTRATTSGSGLQSVPANRIAQFQVQTNGAGEAELKVNITSPTGRPVMSTVNGSSQAGYTVEYTPMEVGRYYVAVQYAETDISGSPFSPEAYNASLIQVSSLQDGIVGQPVTFQVDTSMAGAGNLTVDVVGQTTNAYPEIAPRGGGKYDVVFVPTEMGPHNITITFNGEHVTGSPFTTSVFDLGALCVSWESVRLVSVGKMAVIELDTKGAPKGDIIARVLGPQGQTLPLQVTEQAGCFQIAFLPDVVGAHTIDLQYASRVLPGSPFTAFAFDSGAVRIVDVTQTAVLRQQVGFTVDTEDAGQGDVDVEVACGGQLLRTQREKLGPSSHRYSFVPIMAADHTIDITFNYEKVPGCPLMLKVVDPSERISLVRGSSMQKAMVDQNAWVMIDTQRLQLDTDDTQVSVTAPNGELVPAKIVRQPDDDYKVEYSSKYTGRHTVEILYAGLAIMGSPFYVEIYDPNKLYIEGARSGIVGQKVEFDIIRHEAGKAELSLNITCPSGRPVQYDITPTPQGDHVSYTPLEAGPHQIFITYGGLEVPGCPMTQNISSATISSAYGDGLLKGQEHKAATFYVDTKGQSGDLFVQVDGPNSIAKYKVEQDNQGRHVVSYVPVEVGHYTILVKWNGKEIEGSPFHPKIVDPGKVYVLGGWESILDGQNRMALTVNQMRRIEFDTSLAGEGQLTAEVSGPNGAHPFTMEGYGNRFTLSITPQMEGEYHVSLWWCDLLLPRSPLNGVATSAYSSLPPQPPPVIVEPSYNSGVNHERVVLTGRGLTEASVQETTQFVIDGTDAGPGIPEVRMTGVKTDIDVRTVLIGDNKYRCMYVPQVPGAYLLNIMWSDRQVRGSPFKVNVSARGDASKVTCNGDGLVMGIMGREIRSTIDARRAGPGELTAHCMGPTKVAMCELYDQNDGTFTLNVKPQEPGAHVLQVKYGGEHVPGSPFHIKVSGAPDASKVKVKGPGIEHGILATYRSHFICETRGAGAGQLTVRVRGPKGAFRVEMQRESQKDRTILCRYDPTEVGVYVLHIKWSGQQIPGSPFQVHIFDTKQELDRLMSETRRRPAPGNASTTEASMTWGDDM